MTKLASSIQQPCITVDGSDWPTEIDLRHSTLNREKGAKIEERKTNFL